jgi:lysozyme family protein
VSGPPFIDPFVALILPVLQEEGMGTLTNDPNDPGGVTIWGVTEAIARAAGYVGPMGAMTKDQAIAIYRTVFWQQPHFDLISALIPTLAAYMLDIGVNLSPAEAGKFLQRSLNVLNNAETLFADLKVDGTCGAKTQAALKAYRVVRAAQDGDLVILGMVRAMAVIRYVELAEAKPGDERYEFGWQRARALSLA